MAATASISKTERSYIQTSLHAVPPFRADGRGLYDFRTVLLETGVAALANGSARVSIGKDIHEGGGGTEVLAAGKLEVEDIEIGEGVDGGRIVCTVSCSPSAYSHLSPNALDELQYDYTTVLHQTLSHHSLHPSNLGIIPRKKSWLLNLDLIVLSDAGNVYDAMFMAARAALWDTKVPITRSIQFTAKSPAKGASAGTGEEMEGVDSTSGFDTRQLPAAADFELPDYWDEGEALGGRELWPVCVTLNIHSSIHFLDATPAEEASAPLRLLLMFSVPPSKAPTLQGMRTVGSGELGMDAVQKLVAEGQEYAREIWAALETKLRDEDIRRTQKARDRFAVR